MRVAGKPLRILPGAALFGPNAGGKSNLLSAFAFMRDAVLNSFRYWDPDGGVPRQPYAWLRGPSTPTMMEVELVLRWDRTGRHRVSYGFTADDASILDEWLAVDGRTLYERGGDRLFAGGLAKPRANALGLSAIAQFEDISPFRDVFAWFRRARILAGERFPWPAHTRRAARQWMRVLDGQLDLFASPNRHDQSLQQAVVDLLAAADISITGFRRQGGTVHCLHDVPGQPGASLPISEESPGTQRLIRLGASVMDALRSGSLLVVDEPETHLHPNLLASLTELFNDPETNPHQAQFLYATHEASLLSRTWKAPVREDQAWLVHNDDGVSRIERLSDYDLSALPRRLDLDAAYRQGRFGGTPVLSEFDFTLPEDGDR